METCECPNFSSLPPPSSSFPLVSFAERVITKFWGSAVSAVISNLFYAIFTFFFVVVGATLGAITGALISLKTQSGFVHGVAVGGSTGAVFFMQVFKTSLALWLSDDGIGCFLSMIDIISGTLVGKWFGPALLSAAQSQIDAIERTAEDLPSNFDTRCAKGLSKGSIEKIPKTKITANNVWNTSGERLSCSVCLQDFQLGETCRSLPPCRHIFHQPCIDKWLLVHGSCPLCRRDL